MNLSTGPQPAPGPDAEDTPLKARAVKVSANRRTRTITVVCPYCSKTHVHGWPHGDAAVGTRASHCRDARAGQGYLVTEEHAALERWESGRW